MRSKIIEQYKPVLATTTDGFSRVGFNSAIFVDPTDLTSTITVTTCDTESGTYEAFATVTSGGALDLGGAKAYLKVDTASVVILGDGRKNPND